MSVDYHRLLWQELNKNFSNGTNSTFVMAVGQQLLYSDYDVSGNVKVAAYNTYELLNKTAKCGTNYTPGDSRISLKWKQLLYEGKGPNAGPQQQAAFEKARAVLYIDYANKKHTKLYEDYLDKKAARDMKKVEMEFDYQDKYGDRWQVRFDKMFPITRENQQFENLDREIRPYLRAIDEWTYGPLAGVLIPIKEGKNTLWLKLHSYSYT